MLSQKFKNTARLNRNELKNVTGGNGPDLEHPDLCELACGFNDDQSIFGCIENQKCELYMCRANVYATRCVF